MAASQAANAFIKWAGISGRAAVFHQLCTLLSVDLLEKCLKLDEFNHYCDTLPALAGDDDVLQLLHVSQTSAGEQQLAYSHFACTNRH